MKLKRNLAAVVNLYYHFIGVTLRGLYTSPNLNIISFEKASKFPVL